MVKVSDFLAAKYVTVPRPARHWPGQVPGTDDSEPLERSKKT